MGSEVQREGKQGEIGREKLGCDGGTITVSSNSQTICHHNGLSDLSCTRLFTPKQEEVCP